MWCVFNDLHEKSVRRPNQAAKNAIICSPISVICFSMFHFCENGKQVMSFVFNDLREKSVSRPKHTAKKAIICFPIA